MNLPLPHCNYGKYRLLFFISKEKSMSKWMQNIDGFGEIEQKYVFRNNRSEKLFSYCDWTIITAISHRTLILGILK